MTSRSRRGAAPPARLLSGARALGATSILGAGDGAAAGVALPLGAVVEGVAELLPAAAGDRVGAAGAVAVAAERQAAGVVDRVAAVLGAVAVEAGRHLPAAAAG